MEVAVEQRDALQRQLDERNRTLSALREEAAKPRGWRAWFGLK
jgi:hypothetical protein